MTTRTTKTTLSQDHIDHLLTEGFTQEQIDSWVANGDIESLTPNEARDRGFGVCKLIDPENSIYSEPLTGGLLLKFSDTFIQLRTDNPDLLPKPDGKPSKYLTPIGRVIDTECALIPEGCKAITEGWKDAKAFSLLGIPTGAITGLSVGVKALPEGCGYTSIGDHDTWANFGVTRSIIRLSIHCEGKIAVVPEIKGFPKAGGVEYSKDGNTAEDFHLFLANALTPHQMYLAWLDKRILRLDTKSPAIMADVAVEASKLLAELYGKSTSPTKAEIKVLLKSTQFEGFGLDLNSVLRDSGNTVEQLKAEIREESGGDVDIHDALVEIVERDATLFHSPQPDSINYASVPDKSGVNITYPVNSKGFVSWLTFKLRSDVSKRGLTSDDKNKILSTVESIAEHDSPELPVSKQRIAAHKGQYYLYLADENQTVIEYSAIGWGICDNSPVKFPKDKYKAALPIPCRGGEIDKLWDIVRVQDELDRLVVLTTSTKILVPGGTDPILAFSGYQGSGKTSAANTLRSILDPFSKGQKISGLPSSMESIAIHAQTHRVLGFDNISVVTQAQNDFLCTVSTGGGITKRTLYTDDEETIIDVHNVTIMTSIGQVITKPDLLERSIVIDMTRLTELERKSESELVEGHLVNHADILGALLDITVAALAHRESTTAPKYNRMVDFTHLGEGIEKYLKLPKDSLKGRLASGVEIANEITIESSPVASLLRIWALSLDDKWEGTLTVLLNILRHQAKRTEQAASLPQNANALGGELKKCESALHQSGIVIEDYRESKAIDPNQTKKKRVYVLKSPKNFELKASPPSPPTKKTPLETIPINTSNGGEQTQNPSPPVRLPTNSNIEDKSTNSIQNNTYSGGEGLINTTNIKSNIENEGFSIDEIEDMDEG